LKRAVTSPLGFRTGPVDSASWPEASTSTWSGSHEKGAFGPSKKAFQPSITAALPRNTLRPPKNSVSSATRRAKAAMSRSAMLRANARSAANTSARQVSCALVWAPADGALTAKTRAIATAPHQPRAMLCS
jgi:hypothetical protein